MFNSEQREARIHAIIREVCAKWGTSVEFSIAEPSFHSGEENLKWQALYDRYHRHNQITKIVTAISGLITGLLIGNALVLFFAKPLFGLWVLPLFFVQFCIIPFAKWHNKRNPVIDMDTLTLMIHARLREEMGIECEMTPTGSIFRDYGPHNDLGPI